MNNKEFAAQLEKRTKTFAISIIKLSSSMTYTPENKIQIKIKTTLST